MKMVYGIAGITITLGYPDIRSVCVCVGKTHNSNGAQLLWQVLITCDRHPLTFPLSGPKRKLLLGHPSSRLGHFQNVCPHIRAIVCSTSLRVSDTQTHWSQFHFLPTSAIKKSSKCWLISQWVNGAEGKSLDLHVKLLNFNITLNW